MSASRVLDYLDHMRRAAIDAISFVEGLGKGDFLGDKRTQPAVIMSLVVIGALCKPLTGRIGIPQCRATVTVTQCRS